MPPVPAPTQTEPLIPASSLKMRPGEYKKEEPEKLICQNNTCGIETGLLFSIDIQEDNKVVEKKYCEKCWKAEWLKRGYIR